MSSKRRKFSKDFKAKVVLEALKEQQTIESLAKKHELQPKQISTRKGIAINNFGLVFSNENSVEKEKQVDSQSLIFL